MAFYKALSLLLFCLIPIISATEVPVYIWGDIERSSVKHSALSSVPLAEFRQVLKREIAEDPFTVIFIEETLSVEDLSHKIDDETPYPYLESQIDDAVYFPSVESPLRVLTKLADQDKVDHVKLTDTGLSADMNNEDGKFLFIYLKDAKEGESRKDLLRRHNDFMEDMVSKLQERYDKVVAVYTARNPSWTVVEHSRVRRQAPETQQAKKPRSSTPPVTSLSFNGLKIYFENVLMKNGSEEVTLTGAQGDPTSYVNDTTMNSVLLFSNDVKVTLNFETFAGYWFLNTASLQSPAVELKTLYSEDPLYGYTGFSYRCAVNITMAVKPVANSTNDGSYAITFQNARIQPFFSDNSTDLEFGDMLNCVGFFSAPIWAGLFVTFILLAITFFGITMMMDIRTMDRFDDPKGKTITINTSE